MNTKELEDGTLCLDGDILDGAEEAYNNTRYVEAFALLHAHIDWWMTDLIQLDGCVRDSSKTTELLFNTKYRFGNSLNCLKRKEIIDDKEYRRLQEFNRFRNLIIHRLVTRSYGNRPSVETNRVTINEVEKGFKDGMELARLLMGKTGLVILERRKNE
jgi:hypothetical protein